MELEPGSRTSSFDDSRVLEDGLKENVALSFGATG
jgi:hypothetical protein